MIDQLFRTEFSKIVGVLCQKYGISTIQIAEDIASDTFLIATETWALKGLPENPKAWLYAVAKNKTKDYFKRQSLYQNKILPEINLQTSVEIDLSEENIKDSQLLMLFNVCDPNLTSEAQICLALRILCGLGIDEIASALLTSKSTINKRLLRAKESYRKYKVNKTIPQSNALKEREQSVLSIIYLLFNEGYYSTTSKQTIKKHLCLEAMRLLYLFIESNKSSEAMALMSLFCFHASRFEAREDQTGSIILYEDQDTSLWDTELIAKGQEYLQKAAVNTAITKYHLEATIAFWHTRNTPDKWENILYTYNYLLQVSYSPITALNRTYALYKVKNKAAALKEALKLQLDDNHLYHCLLAELYTKTNDQKAKEHLNTALNLARNSNDRLLIEKKINEING